MIFTLYEDHRLVSEDNFLGVSMENKSEMIEIYVEDESLWDKWAYIEFSLAGCNSFSTSRLPIDAEGVIRYELLNNVLVTGNVRLQVVFKGEDDWVWKSLITTVEVKNSLNVTEHEPLPTPTVLNQIEERISELEDHSLMDTDVIDNLESDSSEKVLAARQGKVLDQRIVTIENTLPNKADLVDGKVPSSELPSYVDDVLEYPTLSDFPEEGEKSKIYVALDTGYTYRWSGSEYVQIGGQDLSNYPRKDTNETITGTWGFHNITVNQILGENSQDYFSTNSIRPVSNGTYNLGNLNLKWNSIYSVYGRISWMDSFGASNNAGTFYIGTDNNPFTYITLERGFRKGKTGSNYELLIPDTTNWTANKEIATTDQTFNVINASDIVNNTLTQAQYDLITNGKPTLISGNITISNEPLVNPMVMPMTIGVSSTYGALFSTVSNGRTWFWQLAIRNDTKVISLSVYNSGQIRIGGLEAVNGKYIPVYPSSTGTFGFKSVNGTLKWAQEWYGTQAEYDALGTYDSNIMYYILED